MLKPTDPTQGNDEAAKKALTKEIIRAAKRQIEQAQQLHMNPHISEMNHQGKAKEMMKDNQNNYPSEQSHQSSEH